MNKFAIGAAIAALSLSSAALAEALPQSQIVPVSAGAEQVAAQATGLTAGFTTTGIVAATTMVAGITLITVNAVDSGESAEGTPGTPGTP
jgi:hypothetical protein